LNKVISLIYRAGTGSPTVSKEQNRNSNQGKLGKGIMYRGGTYSYVSCAILTASKHKRN
jgi:hypothetical protein